MVHDLKHGVKTLIYIIYINIMYFYSFVCLQSRSVSSSRTLKSWQQIRAKIRVRWCCTRWSWWAAAAWENPPSRCSSCMTRWVHHKLYFSYKNSAIYSPSCRSKPCYDCYYMYNTVCGGLRTHQGWQLQEEGGPGWRGGADWYSGHGGTGRLRCHQG